MLMLLLTTLTGALAAQPIGLNSATAPQLAALAKVDADTAERIVGLRSERGRLNSVDELRILPGLTGNALDRLRSGTAIDIDMPLGGVGVRYDNPEQVMAQFAHEPTPQQAQAWANTYATMSPDQLSKWLKQSTTAALLPLLWVRYQRQQTVDRDFEYFATDGVIDTDGEVLFDVLDDAGIQNRDQYMVQARWDLDELVMNTRKTAIIRENRNYVKLRDQILTEVNRIYFERRRIQVEMILSPKVDVLGQVKDQLRIMELTANLDALTGGRFSAALARQDPNVVPR